MSASARGCFPRKKQKQCERRQTSAGQGPDTQGGRHSVRPPKERVLKRGVLQQAV